MEDNPLADSFTNMRDLRTLFVLSLLQSNPSSLNYSAPSPPLLMLLLLLHTHSIVFSQEEKKCQCVNREASSSTIPFHYSSSNKMEC